MSKTKKVTKKKKSESGGTESKVRATESYGETPTTEKKTVIANYKTTHVPPKTGTHPPASFSPSVPLRHIAFHSIVDGFHKKDLHINEIKDLKLSKTYDVAGSVEFKAECKEWGLIFPVTSILYYETL